MTFVTQDGRVIGTRNEEEVLCVDVPNAEPPCSSGPSSLPSEREPSSIADVVVAIHMQAIQMERLALSIEKLTEAVLHQSQRSGDVLEALLASGQDGDEDDDARDLLGNRVL